MENFAQRRWRLGPLLPCPWEAAPLGRLTVENTRKNLEKYLKPDSGILVECTRHEMLDPQIREIYCSSGIHRCHRFMHRNIMLVCWGYSWNTIGVSKKGTDT